MPNSIPENIRFVGIKSKKLESDFNGGRIVSDAGAVLLRQADRNLHLIDAMASHIKDNRHKSYINHPLKDILRQRVNAIACGYEDGNDHTELRKDPIFKIANNRGIKDADMASASTISRLENSVTRKDLIAMSKVMVEQFISSFDTEPDELILDFDATDDRIHGKQEKRFFHGYYDGYCYLPLYVFCSDKLLVSYLRPSNIDGAKHTWAILSLLVKRLRQEWPEVKIIMRADSGFCRHKMLTWCESNTVYYVIGIAKNKRLTKTAKQIIEKSRDIHKQTNQKVRLFGHIRYAAKTWSRERRIIVKAEQLKEGENIRYIVTNMEEEKGEYLYDGIYVKRGDMENRIKEQQLDLFADRTSCTGFMANQFRLILASCAYILLEYIRRVGLKGTRLAGAQVGTIRLKLLKIGAIIIENTKRILIKISETYVYKDIFKIVAARLL